jgi:3'(2'), 5'-bisphosphate nucleotidase
MSSSSTSALRHVAINAVRAASAVCRRVQQSMVIASAAKVDTSPVTCADLASQAVVVQQLRRHTGDTRVMAEEDSEQIRLDAALRRTVAELAGVADDEKLIALLEHDNGREFGANDTYWVLDPVDGTKGFLRREQYAVCLALVERGRPVLAVLACPNWTANGTLLVAERGRGAETLPLVGDAVDGGRRVRVSSADNAADIVVTQSVDSATLNQDEIAAVLAQLGVRRPTLALDSATKYAAVATGAASLYLRLPNRADYFEKVWDHAAGALVVEEAGGAVSDINGAPLDFAAGRTLARNRGILASNGVLHQRALAAIAASCVAPVAPTPPREFECCGNGCDQCVYILYDESANKYRDEWARYRARMRLRGVEVGEARVAEAARGSVAEVAATSVSAFEEFERKMKMQRGE